MFTCGRSRFMNPISAWSVMTDEACISSAAAQIKERERKLDACAMQLNGNVKHASMYFP